MRILTFSIIAAMLAVGATSPSIAAPAAETVCKGLVTDVCGKNTGCSWVKPYKTKKGTEVAGFCRKKVSRKPAPAKTTG